MNKGSFEQLYIQDIPEYIRVNSEIVGMRKGDTLFRAGDAADAVWIPLSGLIGINNETMAGETERVVWVLPGEIVGEMEVLVGHETFLFSARSYEDNTSVRKIPKDVFLKWINDDSAACLNIAKTLARKLFESAYSICERSSDSFSVICGFITSMAQKEINKSTIVVLRYTRSEIASACRISERTVNRCVKKLKEMNFISVIRGKVAISERQYSAMCQMLDDIPTFSNR
jgi:CRP-like cAMP-binding protein